MRKQSVFSIKAQILFSVFHSIPFIETHQSLVVASFQPYQNKTKVCFGKQGDGFFIQITKSRIESKVTVFFMQSTVYNAFGKFPSLCPSVPYPRVVEYFAHMIIFNQALIFIQAFLHRTHGKSEIRPIVTAKSTFTEHAVADHTGSIDPRRLEVIAVFKSIIFPSHEITINIRRQVKRLYLFEISRVVKIVVITLDRQTFNGTIASPI